jgi:acid phosphatase type 7
MAPFADHRLRLGAGRFRLPHFRCLRAASVALALLAGLAAAGPAQAAQVTVVPAAQVPGQPVQTSGSGFPAGAQGTVRLGRARVADFRADAGGRFRLSYGVPAVRRHGMRPLVVQAGSRSVRLRVSVQPTVRTARSLSKARGARRLVLAPYDAAPGTARTIRGNGWPRRVGVRVMSGRTVVARARSTRSGRFRLVVRGLGTPGTHSLVVKASRRRLAVPFSVTAAPAAPAPPPAPPAASADPRIAAAGDIACNPADPTTSTRCRHGRVSDLLVAGGFSAVLPLGDAVQYEGGQLADYLASYDPTWGRVKSITYPTPGNWDYQLGNANGYFDYFGDRAGDRTKGYYAFDVGSWRLYSLNSNCDYVACGAGSEQEAWLRADLIANPRACRLAYWHHPLFNSGLSGQAGAMRAIWRLLHAGAVDVVLSGHDHHYERFAPQDATGVAAPGAPREFIVGTGGDSHNRDSGVAAANSEVRNYDTFGVLALTLHPAGYDWAFVPEKGRTFTDAGSQACS